MSEATNYIVNLLKEFGNRDVNAFIDTAAEDISSIYLSKVAEGRDEEVEEEEDSDEEIEEESTDLTTVSSAISDEDKLVILGNPGSGKTTILIHELVQLCHEFIDGTSQLLPIFVAMKDLRQDYALSDAFNKFLISTELLEYIKNGNAILFLDGLNELNGQIYDSTLLHVKQLISDYPALHLVITSRKYGYSNQLGIAQYEVHAFDDTNVQDYTYRRTGNIQLYRALKKNRRLYTLASTPLMLKMITDIWTNAGSLPSHLSSLYSKFIDYQLSKSLNITEEEKDKVLNVLSLLAFELRHSGYISDSTGHLREIVGFFVEESDCERLSDELLKSGLLVINTIEGGYDFVSFIHETFQEYFCSLYLVKVFRANKYFSVDVADGQWKETIGMAIEILLEELSEEETISMLDTIRLHFLEKSENKVVDEYLYEFVSLMRGAITMAPLVENYVEQYVAFNMNNYIQLPREERTVELFAVIVSSIMLLPKSNLHRLLFEDESGWMQEWLYLDEELHAKKIDNSVLKEARKEKQKQFILLMVQSVDRVIYYNATLHALRKYAGLDFVVKRLEAVLGKVTMSLSLTEAKEAYLAENNIFTLLLTMDETFVETEIAKMDFDIDDLSDFLQKLLGEKFSKTKKLHYLSFYYNYIIPRYSYGFLVAKQFREDLVNCIGLLDALLDNGYWQEHFDRLAEIVFMLPERYWTKKYKEVAADYIQKKGLQLVPETVRHVHTVSFRPIFHVESGYILYLETTKLGKSLSQDLIDSMQAEYGTDKCSNMYLGALTIKSNLGNVLNVEHNSWTDLEVLKREYPLISLSEENGKAKLYFDVTSTKGLVGVKNVICIDDNLYRVNKKNYRCVLAPVSLTSWEFVETIEQAVKTAKLLEAYCYHSRDFLLKFTEELKNFTPDELCKLGIIGYFPESIKKIIKPSGLNLFYVKEIRKDGAFLIGHKRNNKKVLVACYDDLQVGDVCVLRKKIFYKIHDTHRLGIYGYHTGIITNAGKWKIIIKDDADGQKYVAQNNGLPWWKGDSVSFWPTEILNPYHDCYWTYDVLPLEK